MMELDHPQHIVNVLVLCDHFTRHIMVYVTPDKTGKKLLLIFLWQGCILIFGALAKLLSDWGANFQSNIISELCELIGIWKGRILPYHPQANRQVEQAHQMLMQMIGKLSKYQVADWPKHPLELLHGYNSMRSVITGYSLHYLMFGQWLCPPINFYFPTIMSTEKHQHVDHYVAGLCEQLCEAFKEAQVQSTSEAEMQRQYYDHKANAISLEPGDLVWAKGDAYKGRRKVKDQWEEEPYKVECRIAEGIPSYFMKNQWTRCSWVLHWNQLLLITPIMGAPLCSGVGAEWTMCTTTILEEPTWETRENKKAPQSGNCLLLIKFQTGECPLGWVDRKLCALLRMFLGASLLHHGWKVWFRGKGMCGHQWCHSGGGGTDHTDEFWKIWPPLFSSIPPVFILEITSLKHKGHETGTLAHASIFGMLILS